MTLAKEILLEQGRQKNTP